MTEIMEAAEKKARVRRPWTKDKHQTGVRLTAAEQKMLRALVRKLGLSQNAVLVLALRELHDERIPNSNREAA